MNKYITLFFSVSLFLFSCKGKNTPAGIINHNQMVGLLTDIHITDGIMYSFNLSPDSLYKYGAARYVVLFKQHHTDSAQFRKSLKYYSLNAAEMLAIYDQVLKNLKVKTDSITKKVITQGNAVPAK